ncbi:hypothetical protein Sango_2579100 [Sesamum angolense]|uniref:Uncharacterized protein n=1 Tax=Sesamum angolense TaxID=2727404 RepID=A0AAE1W5B1_9LAMI|nr:hypothetical protein Sango_2579100 [Sesamum angolense]
MVAIALESRRSVAVAQSRRRRRPEQLWGTATPPRASAVAASPSQVVAGGRRGRGGGRQGLGRVEGAHIVHSMKDPSIAAFWLITLPQIVGGMDYDDDVKQKIWWQYKESMRYDQLRDEVAKREPGWEDLQEKCKNIVMVALLYLDYPRALISIDPSRAKDDPVVVKNIPFYKAKKALEAEVMKLNPPPRPHDWGDLDLPLNASSWSEEDLKDPKKQYEMTILLNAQREIADKILDTQWETKWRAEKLNEMLREKVEPYLQNIDNGVLPQPIVLQSQNHAQKNALSQTHTPSCLICCREIRAGDDGGCFNGLGLQVEVSIHEAHIHFDMPWPLPG